MISKILIFGLFLIINNFIICEFKIENSDKYEKTSLNYKIQFERIMLRNFILWGRKIQAIDFKKKNKDDALLKFLKVHDDLLELFNSHSVDDDMIKVLMYLLKNQLRMSF